MPHTSTYTVRTLDTLIDDVRRAFRGKLAADPTFFGNDEAVTRRIKITLDDDSPKGTLAVRKNIDADSTSGIMRTVDLTLLDLKATPNRAIAP